MCPHVLTGLLLSLGILLSYGAGVNAQEATAAADDRAAAEKAVGSANSLHMTPAIVCRSIDGYEAYERLPGAAQTSEEKLLVYFRPLGYRTELVDGLYQAHLTPDFQIRRRGQKAILRQKERIFEYKPRESWPPENIYMRATISIKGLPPGDYDLTIILHDLMAKGSLATQVVKFKIIPNVEPRKKSNEIDSGAAP
jgi:hypothetical protein